MASGVPTAALGDPSRAANENTGDVLAGRSRKDRSSPLAPHLHRVLRRRVGSNLAPRPTSCARCPACTSAPSYARRVAAAPPRGPWGIKAHQRLGTRQEPHKCQGSFPSPQSLSQGQVQPTLGTYASPTIFPDWNRPPWCRLAQQTHVRVHAGSATAMGVPTGSHKRGEFTYRLGKVSWGRAPELRDKLGPSGWGGLS